MSGLDNVRLLLEKHFASIPRDVVEKFEKDQEAQRIQDDLEIEKEVDELLDAGVGGQYVEMLEGVVPNIDFRRPRNELEREKDWGIYRAAITIKYVHRKVESGRGVDSENPTKSPIRKYVSRLRRDMGQRLSLTILR
jgi:hypothetical protein